MHILILALNVQKKAVSSSLLMYSYRADSRHLIQKVKTTTQIEMSCVFISACNPMESRHYFKAFICVFFFSAFIACSFGGDDNEEGRLTARSVSVLR